MHRSAHTNTNRHFPTPLLGAAVLAGALLAGTALAAGTPGGAPAKPTSSCVACHTDVARIQEEAKGIPVPTGSALQAGKG
jgi:hypothetical protein